MLMGPTPDKNFKAILRVLIVKGIYNWETILFRHIVCYIHVYEYEYYSWDLYILPNSSFPGKT